MARVKISFARDSDSLAADLIEGNGDWGLLGSHILETYNDVSGECYELYQRSMINCTHEFSEYNVDADVIDTYWTSFVACNSSCPMEDPLFGIDDPLIMDPDILGPDILIGIDDTNIMGPDITDLDIEGPDILTRMLRPRSGSSNPTEAPTPLQSTAPSEAPSSAPTDRPVTPISRKEFLHEIRAESVESTRITFAPSATPSSMPSYVPSSSPSQNPSKSPSDVPTIMPSSSTSPSDSSSPSDSPSGSPSGAPSYSPTNLSAEPSSTPSSISIDRPSVAPSTIQSAALSAVPSATISAVPSDESSYRPSGSPSKQHSGSPSYSPPSGVIENILL